MPTITLGLPSPGQGVTAGLHSANYAALQTLLNGGLDNANISAAATLDAVARHGVRVNSAGSTYNRRRLNVIAGAGITLALADDSGSEEADLTISASPGAMTLISDSTLGADAATIDLTAIPGTYKHLLLVMSLRGNNASVSVNTSLRFNNDSAANYDYNRLVLGDGAVNVTTDQFFATTELLIADSVGDSARALRFTPHAIRVVDYAQTSREKAVEGSGGFAAAAALSWTQSAGGAWRSTAAINQITIIPGAGSWKAGSRVSLYGVS